MKSRLTYLSLLIVANFSAQAQMILNQGDVWTHSFSTLPNTITGGLPFTFPPNGTVIANFSSFPAGSTMRYEMFEGGPVGPPILSGLVTSGATLIAGPPYAWQDLNGSVRFTMLTGACAVASVTLRADLPNPLNPVNRYDEYSVSVSLTSPPPRLVVQRGSRLVQVSWWTNGASGYVLEATNALRSGAWPAATNTPSVISNRYAVTLSPTNQMYFRLRK